MSRLPELLKQEIDHNLSCLRSDLNLINRDSGGQDRAFAEEYRFEQFNSFLSKEEKIFDETMQAFYRSLHVLVEGHPGLMSADARDLEQAYRTIIESAIQFGERLLEASA